MNTQLTLGQLVGQYVVTFRAVRIYLVGAVICLALMILFFVFASYPTVAEGGRVPARIVGAVFAILAVWILILVFQRVGRHITLYQNGLEFTQLGRTLRLVWDNIDAVVYNQFTTEQEQYGTTVVKITTKNYRLLKDGRILLKFDEAYQGIDELGARVRQVMLIRFFPQLEARLLAGKIVAFGSVNIDLHGIRSGKNSIEWAQVYDVVLGSDDRSLILTDVDGKEQRFSLVNVPNAHVLYALVLSVVMPKSEIVTRLRALLQNDTAFSQH